MRSFRAYDHFNVKIRCLRRHVTAALNMVQTDCSPCAFVVFARFLNLHSSIRDPLPALHTKPAASDLAESYLNSRDHISKPEILSLTSSKVDVVCGSKVGVRRRESAQRVLVLGGSQERQEKTRDEHQERSACANYVDRAISTVSIGILGVACDV
jgi:hypothetical protein